MRYTGAMRDGRPRGRSRSPGRSRGGQSHLVADVPLATRPARLPEARKPGLAPAREAWGGGTAAAVGEHGRGRGLQRGLQTSCGLQTSRSLNLQVTLTLTLTLSLSLSLSLTLTLTLTRCSTTSASAPSRHPC